MPSVDSKLWAPTLLNALPNLVEIVGTNGWMEKVGFWGLFMAWVTHHQWVRSTILGLVDFGLNLRCWLSPVTPQHGLFHRNHEVIMKD